MAEIDPQDVIRVAILMSPEIARETIGGAWIDCARFRFEEADPKAHGRQVYVLIVEPKDDE